MAATSRRRSRSRARAANETNRTDEQEGGGNAQAERQEAEGTSDAGSKSSSGFVEWTLKVYSSFHKDLEDPKFATAMLRRAVAIVGAVFIILVGFRWGLSSRGNINNSRKNNASSVSFGADIDDAYVRAIVAEETASLLANHQDALLELEKSVALLEAESKQWIDILELDLGADIDPAAHTALAKIESMYTKIRQDNKDMRVETKSRGTASSKPTDEANAILHSLEKDIQDISRRMKALDDSSSDGRDGKSKSSTYMASTSCIDESDARNIVRDMLDTYAADVIGRPDFALASVGATIERRKGMTSQDYFPEEFSSNPLWWFYSVSKSAESAIDSDLTAGNCWACGINSPSQCNLTVRLRTPITISAVSIDHISPKIALDMQSAPKRFRVFGVRELPQGDEQVDSELLGEFEYKVNDGVDDSHQNAPQVQTFPIERLALEKFWWVTFQFLENYGHPEWTCVYRVRVH